MGGSGAIPFEDRALKAQARRDVAKNPKIRIMAPGNPSTPTETLVMLAAAIDDWVRENMAHNPSAPTETLIVLAGDEDPLVSRC